MRHATIGALAVLATIARNYQADGHFYVVEFTIDREGLVEIPATNPPGKPHYPATIQVFEVVNGDRQKVGPQMGGMFTDEGCFEDDPKALVAQAQRRAAEPGAQ